MREIYIVLTYTGTALAKAIKFYTQNEFSHVSISLDKDLKRMYSFGRLNPYNPFWGGFVHEHLDKGTFKRFKNTKARIYSLRISECQYEKIEKTILEIEAARERYKFNILGLFAVAIHVRIKYKYAFYCAEFVKYVLEQSRGKTNLPDLIKPEDFKKLEGIKEIYCGRLQDYTNPNIIRLEPINYKCVS